MGRTMIFVDANNFCQGLNRYYPEYKVQVQISKLISLLSEGRQVIKIFYYLNAFRTRKEDIAKQEDFVKKLEASIPNLKIKLFAMQKRKDAPGYQEKGVDQELTMDMIWESDNFDTAILVSEDKDFVGCVERLIKDKGKKVEVVIPIFGAGHHLRNVATRRRILSVSQIEGIIKKGKRLS